jgi:predicted RNA-binding protein with TRAM domain
MNMVEVNQMVKHVLPSGEIYDARVTAISDQQHGIVNLQVFVTDHEHHEAPLVFEMHVPHNAQKAPGTWHEVEPTP